MLKLKGVPAKIRDGRGLQRRGPLDSCLLCRGDFEQLLVACAGELEADVAISTSCRPRKSSLGDIARRDMLTLLHSVKARRHAAMGAAKRFMLKFSLRPRLQRSIWPMGRARGPTRCRTSRCKVLPGLGLPRESSAPS